ncbi:MAG: bifunctional precorrin-2 dehydrogenase/sirohydrochlorin ferrochelatase [Dehalococcoidia bacterium]|nr:bifunctional precorrin-2 dehydrogenase/sirohydrochlorin ferrochelatase [Dehalococcoidia bacterium]
MKTRRETYSYYPILLNVQGKKCLVVGGGNVALRKVQALLEQGANVEIVSPNFCPELNKLAKEGTVRAINRDYKPEDLKETFIAIAATDDVKTNESLAAQARRLGILVNVVDDPNNSDFIVPSYFRRGDIIIAVSTSGRSPALARKIRSELEKSFQSEYAQLALVADEVRSELKQQGITVSGDAWQKALDLNSLIELLRRGKNQQAREIMLSKLKILEQQEL